MADSPSTIVDDLPISSEQDVVRVRKTVRDLAVQIGFGMTDTTRIVTAASELTRNIVLYAGSGSVRLSLCQQDGKRGLELVFQDGGPGIVDIDQAMEAGFTSGKGLGLGLPGAQRLMDELNIESEAGHGTTVTVRKWLKAR